MSEQKEPLLSFEEEAFLKKKWDRKRMDVFGFLPPDGEGVRRIGIPFMDGEFRAELAVSEDGRVTGRVMDVAAEEEYLPVRIRTRTGAFVGEVREKYAEVLRSVADACCFDEYFVFPQSNRIASAIEKRYGEKPDFPFSTATSYGVFRYAGNRKWYGLIMQLAKGRVASGLPEGEEGTLAEFLNVKIPEDRMKEVLKIPGAYPGYHMDSKNWASVILDGTVPDETVMRLIDDSRNLVTGAQSRRSGRTSWIVPANPAYYDIDAAMAGGPGTVTDWKQGRGIRVGDLAYMYVAAPVSEIRYLCEVTETGIPFSYADENVRISHLMKMRVIRSYPRGSFPFSLLRESGVKMIRGPLTVPEKLQRLLDGFEESEKKDTQS